MNSSEIRESFLQYFEKHSHRRIKSASLIPDKDPTLFFTNAGMVPFKNVFLGLENIGTHRATSSQKCLRVSGKHNDLENVGRTHRHHTFFEMLGNFSFGDYFKKEAIVFAWEYLTEVLKIPKSRLWVTVFREDDEAEQLWKSVTDVPAQRILRLDEADNFWSMGETGPCGPCTEIHYDHGPEHGCGRKECQVGCDCDRYMEIWNLVFMQFNRSADGSMKPLPKPSVDTGMGLERLACVVQGVHSNYDTDLFQPILQRVSKLAGKRYGESDNSDISLRVIADHIRATVFLVSDGIIPSNEGRGYVLRRIMRRAIRHGKLLGFEEPFFFKLVPELIHQFQNAYPELEKNQKFIEEVVRAEEIRFFETLEKGLEILSAEIKKVKAQKNPIVSGEVAFKLYDTYGFPLDLTATITSEVGVEVDTEGFEQQMTAQRTKARSAWKGSGEEKVSEVYQQMVLGGMKSDFLGYQSLQCLSKISAILQDGKKIETAKQGKTVEIFTTHTPFYGESGGQIGDRGEITSGSNLGEVVDTQRPVSGLVSHHVKVKQGEFRLGDEVQLKVFHRTREPTKLNHTATHLLHAALRKILGEHVKQGGSLVAPDRLRFDYSHFQPLTPEEKIKVEDLVNQKIREDIPVEKKEMAYQEALKAGAMALFGEKYGDKVRVLKIDDFSTELCGGTHVDRTGEIGLFKILSDTSVAAGIRRIEALTGQGALHYVRGLEEKWEQLSKKLKSTTEELPDKIEKQLELVKKQEKEISQLKAKLASGDGSGSTDLGKEIQEVNGVKLLVVRRDVEDIQALRGLSDQLLAKLSSGVLVLGSGVNGKATLIVRISKDATQQLNASDLAKKLANMVGGSGGGRADMAQAGGPMVEKLDEALSKVKELIG